MARGGRLLGVLLVVIATLVLYVRSPPTPHVDVSAKIVSTETGEALHIQVDRLDQTSRDIVNRINETAQVVQDSVVKPFREVSALAKGITRGFEAFLFRRQRSTVDQAHQDEELFI